MSAGNLIFLLVLLGAVVAMVSMHRGGGHSHGMGGMGGGCGGHGAHDHGDEKAANGGSSKDARDKETEQPAGHAHDGEPAAAGGRRGC